MDFMTQEPLTPYKMNLPTALKERIESSAKKNRRSISGEIIAALEGVYPEPETKFAFIWIAAPSPDPFETQDMIRLSEEEFKLSHDNGDLDQDQAAIIDWRDLPTGQRQYLVGIASAHAENPDGPLTKLARDTAMLDFMHEIEMGNHTRRAEINSLIQILEMTPKGTDEFSRRSKEVLRLIYGPDRHQD